MPSTGVALGLLAACGPRGSRGAGARSRRPGPRARRSGHAAQRESGQCEADREHVGRRPLGAALAEVGGDAGRKKTVAAVPTRPRNASAVPSASDRGRRRRPAPAARARRRPGTARRRSRAASFRPAGRRPRQQHPGGRRAEQSGASRRRGGGVPAEQQHAGRDQRRLQHERGVHQLARRPVGAAERADDVVGAGVRPRVPRAGRGSRRRRTGGSAARRGRPSGAGSGSRRHGPRPGPVSGRNPIEDDGELRGRQPGGVAARPACGAPRRRAFPGRRAVRLCDGSAAGSAAPGPPGFESRRPNRTAGERMYAGRSRPLTQSRQGCPVAIRSRR